MVEIYQVLVAAHGALRAEENQKLLTKTISGELLYSLSPSRQIKRAVEQFGVTAGTSSILAVMFDATPEQVGFTLRARGLSLPPSALSLPPFLLPPPTFRLLGSAFVLRIFAGRTRRLVMAHLAPPCTCAVALDATCCRPLRPRL